MCSKPLGFLLSKNATPSTPLSGMFKLVLECAVSTCCVTHLTRVLVQTREVQELQRQAQDVETQIRELKRSASKQQQQGAAVKRIVTSEQAAVDALLTRRADLLSAAAMEQVGLKHSAGNNILCVGSWWHHQAVDDIGDVQIVLPGHSLYACTAASNFADGSGWCNDKNPRCWQPCWPA